MGQETLGVDIGGVLIDRVADDSDTSFFADRYLETPEVSGAVEALAALSLKRFGANVHLVSKCGARTEARTRRWLEHRGLYARTGLLPERVHFCRERKDKGPICAQLGVTHFVDDRLDVLEFLTSVERKYLFRPRDADRARVSPPVTLVMDWSEILEDLRCS